MILAKSDTQTTPEPLQPGERIHYITGGGTSFRLGTLVRFADFRAVIVLDSEPHKERRVRPWNVRRAETKGRTEL